jgi:hypothetical protein
MSNRKERKGFTLGLLCALCASAVDFALSQQELYRRLIHVTPAPVFALFKGLDDRVLGGMKMLGGMLVGRRIATADMAADETQA